MALAARASLDDVERRLGRPMTAEERALASVRLDDAASILESEFPDLNDRLSSGEVSEQTVIMIHADMVVRVVRNPDGIVQEVMGSYSRTLTGSAAGDGGIEITPAERRMLSRFRARVGSFRPYLPMVPAHPDPWRTW